jgi:uncharacterized C2H2 Zn-finger protein
MKDEGWMADAGRGAVKADGRRCPKCGAMIRYLYYWEKAINSGEYWPDGFHNVIASEVDEYYLLCPECDMGISWTAHT